MNYRVCKGFHSDDLASQIDAAWRKQELLVLLSPQVKELPELELLKSKIAFPEPPVFALCSSGTLERRLIFYSRRNIEASLEGILSFFELDRIDTVYSFPQPYHVFGLVLGYLFPLLYGKRAVRGEGAYSRKFHEAWLANVGSATMTLGTPTHFEDLLSYVRESEIIPEASYTSIAGGAPVTKRLWEKMRDELRIQSPSIGYGASELSPGATHLPPGRAPLEDGEIGVPLPNLSIEMSPGEGLRVKGPNVCLAIASRSKIEFPTEILLNDSVKRRSDGNMVFSHRTDLVINRGGEKFSAERIEAVLRQKLGIEAVGVGVFDPRFGEELALVVSGGAFNGERVARALKEEFGREFDPELFFPVDTLPVNASSKVDRQACLEYAKEHRRELSH